MPIKSKAKINVPASGIEVRQWFIDAIGNRKSLTLPSMDECEKIARELPGRFFCFQNVPERINPFETAKKHAKLFLRHLPAAKEKIEQSLARRDVGGTDGQAGLLFLLSQMRLAETSINKFLPFFDNQPTGTDTWHKGAREVLFLFQSAFLNSGHMPTSVNENDPLCLLVHAAMSFLGRTESPEAISKALRGERGQKVFKKKPNKISKFRA